MVVSDKQIAFVGSKVEYIDHHFQTTLNLDIVTEYKL